MQTEHPCLAQKAALTIEVWYKVHIATGNMPNIMTGAAIARSKQFWRLQPADCVQGCTLTQFQQLIRVCAQVVCFLFSCVAIHIQISKLKPRAALQNLAGEDHPITMHMPSLWVHDLRNLHIYIHALTCSNCLQKQYSHVPDILFALPGDCVPYLLCQMFHKLSSK